MAKKNKPPEADASKVLPGWIATWSDLAMLMFAFFVMLFSMSTIDIERFQQFTQSISGRELFTLGTGGPGIDDLIGSGIMDLPAIADGIFDNRPSLEERHLALEAMHDIANDFKTYFAENEILEENIRMEYNETSIRLIIEGGILFDSGRADLRPEAIEILAMIANVIFMSPELLVDIEGHTDNVPMNPNHPRFPSNWHLSSARAVSVLVYFVDVIGIDPTRVAARGFGEYHPIATNDTPEGRAQNRRVEISLLHRDFVNDNRVAADNTAADAE